ncbi:MAG: hypothetical protein A2W61_06165 [Deltaproteobacteria bacterium RIFCSPLOWO2_01_44_7]|nr:MAG: hypothetical protein A2712_02055 [Deltaproteobacteria bacterium RIFCSPHIGHO2_01_FULL_43_49]OGQ15091.1 MAG: hypothetical protein A3D22_03425 [Deltaproteobacteria bacterium RIFCSPHIGHO2_02_FULL_44_53]OGQ27289.1 MAG: hypothetical protein A3D98_02650 [Deltaproteobacteria bacterium RIFCSPHIGHO2_12_FULL_44_21]OGQ31608.1 MAG: hypothetical protein A2979_04585 [Deltaproteobacteria bacterium RIFCSPLOWO2_01_FULL_45_74]OGQ42720.1 MAG: hypothetical protein A2W61_06165 [Deltaproteobacteria bacterium 
MKRFSSITFQMLFFLALGVLTVGGLFFSSLSYNIQARGLLGNVEKDTEFLNQVKEIRYHFSFARKEEKNWILFRNPSYLASRKKSLTRGESLLVDIKKQMATPELDELLESLESHLLHYTALGEELMSADTIKKVDHFTKKAKTIDEGVTEQISEITGFLLKRVDESQKIATGAFQTYFVWSLVSVFSGLALFVGAGLLWTYRLKVRLKKLLRATRKMAIGDYSPQLETLYSDELGVLAANFNEMAAKIAEREEKINQITQELIQANNLLKKSATPIHQIPKSTIR